MDVSDAFKAFVTLLALVNPVGVVPIYVSLVADRDSKEQAAIARTAALAVAAIIAISAVAGSAILGVFGIEVAAFRAAGGLILIVMGLGMLRGGPQAERSTPDEHRDALDRASIAVVPLAIPLLAGPGTIATTLVYASHARGAIDYGVLIGSAVVIGLITWLCLVTAHGLSRRLGKNGVGVATRIFGLLLVAMGVEFSAVGLRTLWPGLAQPVTPA
ncbi:MAG TPA: MarC family protein [Casimicrobiaceae bacterium]|nr:MarC family protein [Casimicrobiaceae bacterium]